MSTFIKRLPLLIAVIAALGVLTCVSIASDPKLPLVDGWLTKADARVAAKAIVTVITLLVVLVVATIVQRYVERGLPNRLKGWVLELDWAPEGATEVRDIYEKLQADQEQTATLVRDAVRKIKALEDGGR